MTNKLIRNFIDDSGECIPVIASEVTTGQYAIVTSAVASEEVEVAVLNICATISGSGDNTLVAAPSAGNQIAVWAFVIQNESSTATTMLLKDDAARWRILAQNQGDGLAMVFDEGKPWKLTEATALTLNLSGANACSYSVQYSVIEV